MFPRTASTTLLPDSVSATLYLRIIGTPHHSESIKLTTYTTDEFGPFFPLRIYPIYSCFIVKTLKLNPAAVKLNVFAALKLDVFGTTVFGAVGVFMSSGPPVRTVADPVVETAKGRVNDIVADVAAVFEI